MPSYDPDHRAAAEQARATIRSRFSSDYNAGARAGFNALSVYPEGFHDWPIERRNAWYCGFNIGRLDRFKAKGSRSG